ncbi:hypothetical protein, unlikely [Trypanosoma brucei gambiense DAL972]|uniref:Uncharacterized protein n=1 Tax=Trypanosoma brucei gambiense (strain MHOM/CI/86/DAL972) TaxID=679716 RepID=C9ZHX1_TRYB9|nr:hypothetical protein, unlikely [Trypanosoma brucei gambiense DAL972]CBH08842.1 hypothetical protein, unlikely [Trypanosoma brucei gambiense DAL972]|eukprot:XP_011771283.1 hypothetical protein, unlikely [Trypanosoma brucei gambiense DAL972]
MGTPHPTFCYPSTRAKREKSTAPCSSFTRRVSNDKKYHSPYPHSLGGINTRQNAIGCSPQHILSLVRLSTTSDAKQKTYNNQKLGNAGEIFVPKGAACPNHVC